MYAGTCTHNYHTLVYITSARMRRHMHTDTHTNKRYPHVHMLSIFMRVYSACMKHYVNTHTRARAHTHTHTHTQRRGLLLTRLQNLLAVVPTTLTLT